MYFLNLLRVSFCAVVGGRGVPRSLLGVGVPQSWLGERVILFPSPMSWVGVPLLPELGYLALATTGIPPWQDLGQDFGHDWGTPWKGPGTRDHRVPPPHSRHTATCQNITFPSSVVLCTRTVKIEEFNKGIGQRLERQPKIFISFQCFQMKGPFDFFISISQIPPSC